ncbi:MAG: DUF4416 family protein [bacterium]
MYPVDPVKLFASIIYRDEPVRSDAKEFMMRRWGLIDYESDPVPFTSNDTLGEEMGTPLFRTFVSFARLVDPGEVALIKMACLGLEERFRYQGKRRVNLDPGYLDLYKIVLTSTRYSGPKIYHTAGIYLDNAALFVKDKIQPFPWSYADFKNHFYDSDFLSIRALYQKGLEAHKAQPPVSK